MNKTERTIRDLAEKHNIPITKAFEIVDLYNQVIAMNISDEDKEDEQGLLDIDKFKVISIQNFGKFVPKPKMITQTNNKRLKQRKQHES